MSEKIAAAVAVAELADTRLTERSRRIVIDVRIKNGKRFPIAEKSHKRVGKRRLRALDGIKRYKAFNVDTVRKISV